MKFLFENVRNDVTGVHQIKLPVFFNRAAGKTAVLVVKSVRSDRDGEMFPLEKIFTRHVSPMHGSPFGGVRVVLIKEMVFAVVKAKPVRIVHPADGRRGMVNGVKFCADGIFFVR